MREYQRKYLELLRTVAGIAEPSSGDLTPEEFTANVRKANIISRQAVVEGTELLRTGLFPVLDDILTASQEEVECLYEFAGQLMSGQYKQMDVALHCRIHEALVSYARHKGLRDMLIRELYLVGMSLYNMETMLSPNTMRLFSARMRMCFNESASYFDTEYDDIEDPETKGYIHRSMGNIALSYLDSSPESSEKKLKLIERSLSILNDPEVRAKTPSLPWDTYVYKSHQERTSLLAYLRTGRAGPKAFAQVLESAQIIEEHQQRAAKERNAPLNPRWRYAYMAARYHCGAMTLTDLLEGLYALSIAESEDDFGDDSMFSHVSAPAIFMAYTKALPDGRLTPRMLEQMRRMTERMTRWIVRAPSNAHNEQLQFYLRQFLYSYREEPGGVPFFEVVEDIFASRHPVSYMRMWISSRIVEKLVYWCAEDCPRELVGVLGMKNVSDVIFRRREIADYAMKAARLYDIGMVHFFHMEKSACRGQFEEEQTLMELHAGFGARLLGERASTKDFEDIAWGHHRQYDEKGGFPLDFSPRKSPVRPIIYLMTLAARLASATEETASRYSPVPEFDDLLRDIERGSGTKYAPFAVNLLRPEERRAELRDNMENWTREACLHMYRRVAKN